MGKRWLFNDKLMQIVSQKISAGCSSMSIKNSKKWTFRPFFALPWMRFQNIQNNTDSIFIVVSNNSLVSIRCISSYNSVFLIWTFWLINSCVKDLVRRHQRRKLLILIWIIYRVIDQILFYRRINLNYRSDLRVWRHFSCLKVFHDLFDNFVFSNHIFTHCGLRVTLVIN